MKYWSRLILVLALGISACGNEKDIFSSFNDIPGEIWNWDNPSNFSFDITDDQVTYNQFIDLRLTENYPKSNIYIQSETITPKGDTINQLHNIKLFSKEGSSLGNKSGRLLNYSVNIAKNKKWSKGSYTVKLIQHTRIFELPGINAVGLSISKGEPVF